MQQELQADVAEREGEHHGELEAGQWEGVAGALLYPSRHASAESLARIQAAADEQAIMVTWYDEADWHRQAP